MRCAAHDFLGRRLAGARWRDLFHRVIGLHDVLLDAALPPNVSEERVRRPSLCLDGTPLVYSHPLGGATAMPESTAVYRILVEPGGLGISVADQIDLALGTADRLVQQLGWQEASEDINGVVRRVLPVDARVAGQLWGGIWLGLAASPHELQVRLYLNLRHGNLEARWQRIADAFGYLGDETLESPLLALANRSASLAIPVGIGVVLAEGRLCGLRLYLGIHQPGSTTMSALLPAQDAAFDSAILAICTEFSALAGPFKPQSVTVAYDFALDSRGVLGPRITRTKLDVSCQLQPPEVESGALIARLVAAWGLDQGEFHSFSADLETSFGGVAWEYLSFSVRDGVPSATVYARPVIKPAV